MIGQPRTIDQQLRVACGNGQQIDVMLLGRAIKVAVERHHGSVRIDVGNVSKLPRFTESVENLMLTGGQLQGVKASTGRRDQCSIQRDGIVHLDLFQLSDGTCCPTGRIEGNEIGIEIRWTCDDTLIRAAEEAVGVGVGKVGILRAVDNVFQQSRSGFRLRGDDSAQRPLRSGYHRECQKLPASDFPHMNAPVLRTCVFFCER